MIFLRQLRNNDFDRIMRHQVSLFDEMDRLFTDTHFTRSAENSFPPHNIRKEGNSYLIEMAVAGYLESDITITKEKKYLIVEGSKEANELKNLVYQGIAGRSFKKSFALGERVKVIGAELINGMLYIGLHEEVPEEEKPQVVEIGKNTSEVKSLIS